MSGEGTSEPPVLMREIVKRFGAQTALDGVSMTVRRGEIVGLLGPNGAGKTTALHILLGLTTATSGVARVFGLDVARARSRILARTNFASAYANLPQNLKVWENMRVFALLYDVRDWRPRATALLEAYGISHLRNHITGQLSSGEAARLNLCKALLNEPELLLLDEPTASLDPDMADTLRRSLRALQQERGLTMLYTSHNMRDIEAVCDRILFLHRGRIIAEGTAEAIKARFGQTSLDDVFIAVARAGAGAGAAEHGAGGPPAGEGGR
jgi:ABC-2 type transport system ATP-binding protein